MGQGLLFCTHLPSRNVYVLPTSARTCKTVAGFGARVDTTGLGGAAGRYAKRLTCRYVRVVATVFS